ncbi:Competence protein ComM [Serratia fonticola]|uniref:Competence protein ComM n=1 Tax=Serratia fonticola TaxID=47917 RepID=A0A448TAY3_SERFO|nr:Competence protein ComM [Serratia fonticola]
MSLAVIYTRATIGVQAPSVMVEVHISNGLPGLTLVGLPETTVKEARDRVRSALINNGFTFPAKRITVNLAPADLPKEGGVMIYPLRWPFWRPQSSCQQISWRTMSSWVNWRFLAH